MRLFLFVVMLLLVGCNWEQATETYENGPIYVENGGGSATLSIVEIGGHTYCVAVGLKKVALCPTAETLRWANLTTNNSDSTKLSE